MSSKIWHWDFLPCPLPGKGLKTVVMGHRICQVFVFGATQTSLISLLPLWLFCSQEPEQRESLTTCAPAPSLMESDIPGGEFPLLVCSALIFAWKSFIGVFCSSGLTAYCSSSHLPAGFWPSQEQRWTRADLTDRKTTDRYSRLNKPSHSIMG